MESSANEEEKIKWNEEVEIRDPIIESSSSDNIHETSNIYQNVKCTLISNKDKDFVRSLRDESYRICRESIPINYIKKVFTKFTEGFLYNDDLGRRLGFCIWKVKENIHKDSSTTYSMYIYLICSKVKDLKLSRNIFYDLDNYCKNRRISSIELEAANTDLEKYYETFGFKTETRTFGIMMRKIVYDINLFKQTKKNKESTTKKQTRKKTKIIDHIM